jgi:carbonic anhydrase/acetyltransferase-like protein (isoleucine patch superfamily)
MIYTLDGTTGPETTGAAFIADSASIVGAVTLADLTSVWFSAVIRGDLAPITIGRGTNVQDGAVLHVDGGFPLSLGSMVTVGHRALLHGCTIGNDVLVGMGAIVLNGAMIGAGCIIGAGALVAPGKTIPPRSLVLGVPGRVAREVTEEEYAEIAANARRYIENARRYAAGLATGL